MSGVGDENPPAPRLPCDENPHFSHFFVLSDGSNYFGSQR
jgi:hypothetical protein